MKRRSVSWKTSTLSAWECGVFGIVQMLLIPNCNPVMYHMGYQETMQEVCQQQSLWGIDTREI